ncbi:hypothetical protein F5890DRAFT_1543006 [Lentinula detonsa]|uniref:Uncharacterized protein n=1 Tax=Lentinula detonsa TaxID=2804962 RepID=A0AA38PR13_9AGAR|nr:hypothetical protein F5890DRAFT_1543006 [Lentinula detonsa]
MTFVIGVPWLIATIYWPCSSVDTLYLTGLEASGEGVFFQMNDISNPLGASRSLAATSLIKALTFLSMAALYSAVRCSWIPSKGCASNSIVNSMPEAGPARMPTIAVSRVYKIHCVKDRMESIRGSMDSLRSKELETQRRREQNRAQGMWRVA